MTKSVDDIVAPAALSEGWTEFIICAEPEQKENKKKADGMSMEEGAGENIIVKVATDMVDEDLKGREFTVYLSLPTEYDKIRKTKRGQTYEDFKIGQINRFQKGFTGREMDDTLNLKQGMRGQLYVKQKFNDETKEFENELDNFKGSRVIE